MSGVEYRILKRRRPELLLGFCGCVAQQEGDRALERLPDLDPSEEYVFDFALRRPLGATRLRVFPHVLGFTKFPDLGGPGCVLILSGSNMSGKSTLLRSVGLAVVLARAGAPVPACRHGRS